MNWTTTPPKAGWYWFTKSRLSERQILRIESGKINNRRPVPRGGLWAGPIEPPPAYAPPTDNL